MQQEQENVRQKRNTTQLALPSQPQRNESLRNHNAVVDLTTNLLKLNISQNNQKICLYSVSVQPELDRNNYSLYGIIQRNIDVDLSNHFTQRCFSGYNLFASCPEPENFVQIKTKVKDVEYTVKFTKVGDMDLSTITDFEGDNQRKKSFFEKLIKDILLKNKNTIKFGDERTIVKLNEKNMFDPDPNHKSKESIFKGFYTSAQITENGLFLLVSNVNKHVMETTVYDIILRIRDENPGLSESEKRKLIEDYFASHKTVLTTYGSFRTYRIRQIDFDASPVKTSFNVKEKNGEVKTISIKDYYLSQYEVTLKDPDQPLLIVERKTKQRKALPSGNQAEKDAEPVIYLVPELVYATGIEVSNDSTDRRRNIISKTKIDPNRKIEEIGKIRDMMNNNESKYYKGKDGNKYSSKSSNQISKEWGINLGENLTIQGRLLPQPKLKYGKGNIVKPNNGNFRSGNTCRGSTINQNNFAYVYDKRDKSDIRHSLKGLFDKGKMKGLGIQFDQNMDGIHGIPLNNFSSWDQIKKQLNDIERNKSNINMVVVFLSPQLEKFYSQLKEYFINTCQIATQFVVSKKLQDPKRAGSIMFNIVEQINIKMGGTNFYIDFYGENIIKKGKVYLILGLECRQTNGEVNYFLTSTTNPNLDKMITTYKKCKNVKEDKEKAIYELMQSAIDGISKAPHPPDYIILYRQGGNYVQNKKLAEAEVPMFNKFLNDKKASDEKFKKFNPKFIYVCCNLKGDLKFFEKGNGRYANPKSGLCVDSSVTQKDKYEFYIQPQFVNQGTATPCHYQVLYEDRDNENDENNMKLEELQMLSFYLSFYYWTWAGAVRVPGALKLATTAMDFLSKHLGNKLCLPDQKFVNPTYI
jgi:aubergine-like protein